MNNSEVIIKGLSLSEGVAKGIIFLLKENEDKVPCYPLNQRDIELEVYRYRQALEAIRFDVKSLCKHLSEKEEFREDLQILYTHISILDDPLINEEVEGEIRFKRINVEEILLWQLEKIKKQFQQIHDPFFQHRFYEVSGIFERILSYLKGSFKQQLKNLPKGVVLYSQTLSSFDIMEMNLDCVEAILTESDGRGSHTAITARARGLPYLTNISKEILKCYEGKEVIVDAHHGQLILFPEAATKHKYFKVKEKQFFSWQSLKKGVNYLAETMDGYRVRLSANVDSLQDAHLLKGLPVSGIGLFRTELAFSLGNAFPGEEEQYALYSNLISLMQGRPVVIRVFDVGADKTNPAHMLEELNPVLGCRAIRFLLKEPKIFKTQLKAILRASLRGNARILFPMVTTLLEFLEAKKKVLEAAEELAKEGIKIENIPLIGSMIEVPSAAIITDLLAQEAAFLSIGTNDLVQYALAVDRSNLSLNELYSPTHPSILRLLKWIVSEAHHFQTPISICGDMAADPVFIPLLLGLGIQEFSVPARNIPTILEAIRNTSIVEAYELAQRVFTLRFSSEISEALL